MILGLWSVHLISCVFFVQGSFGDVKCAKRAFDDEDRDLYALKVCFSNHFRIHTPSLIIITFTQICSRSQLKKIKLCEYDIDGALLRYTGVQRFEKECSILESLSHPNVVQFCEVCSSQQVMCDTLIHTCVPFLI